MGHDDQPIIYIGYDSRETIAANVLTHSIVARTKTEPKIYRLCHRQLRRQKRFARPWLIEATTGAYRDLLDDKPFSTEFSHTRFLVPHIQNYKGWALFLDCDMIFASDIKELWDMRDNRYAAMVVKHEHRVQEGLAKMDDRVQLNYRRKNWSSFMLWNCGHPANRKITPEVVNSWTGSRLHALEWLQDMEIGELPKSYNWMSGVSPPDVKRKVIHYTEGGPWFDNCLDVPLAELWTAEHNRYLKSGGIAYPERLPE